MPFYDDYEVPTGETDWFGDETQGSPELPILPD